MVGRAVLLKLADSPRVERLVKRNGMSAGFARRFIAGETIEEIAEPVRALNARGLLATLDHLGENVSSEEEAADSAAYILRLIEFIDRNHLNANVSLKLTQLGLDIADDVALDNLCGILRKASEYGQFVRIDMEGSAYTQRTLDIFYKMWESSRNVGAVIQSYLYRSDADIDKLIDIGARVRLVKGAYREPREVAFQRKTEVDRSFAELAQKLLDRGNYPAIATHDERLIQSSIEHARSAEIETSRYEFQMLYGIRRDRQIELAQQGYRVRVYVPFGTQWYGYMMRRLAERPANLWFVLKNIVRR